LNSYIYKWYQIETTIFYEDEVASHFGKKSGGIGYVYRHRSTTDRVVVMFGMRWFYIVSKTAYGSLRYKFRGKSLMPTRVVLIAISMLGDTWYGFGYRYRYRYRCLGYGLSYVYFDTFRYIYRDFPLATCERNTLYTY